MGSITYCGICNEPVKYIIHSKTGAPTACKPNPEKGLTQNGRPVEVYLLHDCIVIEKDSVKKIIGGGEIVSN